MITVDFEQDILIVEEKDNIYVFHGTTWNNGFAAGIHIPVPNYEGAKFSIAIGFGTYSDNHEIPLPVGSKPLKTENLKSVELMLFCDWAEAIGPESYVETRKLLYYLNNCAQKNFFPPKPKSLGKL